MRKVGKVGKNGKTGRVVPSRNPEKLMRLQAEPPAWMVQAVPKRRSGIGLSVRSVHRLKEEVAKPQILKPIWLRPDLRVNQLDLVAPHRNHPRPGLGAHAEPIDPL